MKRAMLGTLCCVGLAIGAVAWAEQRGEVFTPRPAVAVAAPATTGAELIVIPTATGEKGQVLTVVDPRQRVLSVYHIDFGSGKIALKSVRNIQWDLQMAYLNNENPLPQDIHSLLEQR
jgi:hypothetical protein